MKPRLVWVLLLASLGFNAFFAVGYFSARSTAQEMQTFEGRARLFAKQLKLDASQLAEFDRMLAEVIRARAESRRQRLPHFQTLLAELAKKQPDESVLLAYAERNESREYRKLVVLTMRDFMAILTGSQREIFLHMLRQRAESGN